MVFRFGDFVLDPDQRELRRGFEALEVQPQVFDLLEFLIRNCDRVVSRDDLLAGVWGGRIVSNSAIAARINAARRAICDDGSQQRWIRTIPRKGFRFIGEVLEEGKTRTANLTDPGQSPKVTGRDNQRITFCRTTDGVNLAMARMGSGMPLVCVPDWSNLELDWDNPARAELWRCLADRFELVRYDGRGFGLSDRDVADVSLETLQLDLEAVVAASALRQYALFSVSDSCSAAIAHAAAYPKRVSKMVILSGTAQGAKKRGFVEAITMVNSYLATMGENWSSMGLFMIRTQLSDAFPGLSAEQIEKVIDLLPMTTSPKNAQKHLNALAEVDVVEKLANVSAPTLVLHCRNCRAIHFEQVHRIATGIPNASLVSLETDNFIPLPGEPAWPFFLGAIENFLLENAAP